MDCKTLRHEGNSIDLSWLASWSIDSDKSLVEKDTILIDFDDCVGDFAPIVCLAMNRIGSKACISEYLEYNFSQYHGLTHSQFTQAIVDYRIFDLMPPRKGALEGLVELKNKGYRIIICTARGAFSDAHEATSGWLKHYEAKVDGLIVVDPRTTKKSDVYKSIGLESIVCLVDDALHNLIDAHEVGITPVCIDRPWNQLTDLNFKRFDSIYEFSKELESIK